MSESQGWNAQPREYGQWCCSNFAGWQTATRLTMLIFGNTEIWSHYAVHLELMWCCRSVILQVKKQKWEKKASIVIEKLTCGIDIVWITLLMFNWKGCYLKFLLYWNPQFFNVLFSSQITGTHFSLKRHFSSFPWTIRKIVLLLKVNDIIFTEISLKFQLAFILPVSLPNFKSPASTPTLLTRPWTPSSQQLLTIKLLLNKSNCYPQCFSWCWWQITFLKHTQTPSLRNFTYIFLLLLYVVNSHATLKGWDSSIPRGWGCNNSGRLKASRV